MKLPSILYGLFCLVACLPALAPGAAGGPWWLDLASHFQLPGCILLLLLGLGTMLGKRLLLGGLLLVCGTTCGYRLLPPFLVPALAGPSAVAQVVANQLKVSVVNVQYDNPDRASVLADIRKANPDVLVVVELTPEWSEALLPLKELQLPYFVEEAKAGPFGIGLYAKVPIRKAEVLETLGTAGTPAIRGVLETQHGEVGILGVHLPPPISREGTLRRDAGLAAIGSAIAELPHRRIVAGDFNATPWSRGFARMLEQATLLDAGPGHGVQGTWPARMPALFRVPIDHVLVSPGFGVSRYANSGSLGSDHLARHATLLMPDAH